jgi:hypothetical protein
MLLSVGGRSSVDWQRCGVIQQSPAGLGCAAIREIDIATARMNRVVLGPPPND